MIAEKHGGSGSLKQLALRDWHERAGARFAPFAGWEMPLQYAGIVAEHTAVRTAAGMFDVSHMGRTRVDGPRGGRRNPLCHELRHGPDSTGTRALYPRLYR